MKSGWQHLIRSLMCALLVLTGSAHGAETVTATTDRALPAPVTIYGYHLKPPFIIDATARRGLYFDFADYANRKLGRELFRTEYMPRKRLEQMLLQTDWRAVVIGVNPVWFKDINETRFLWTDALMQDRDEILSSPQRPVEFNGPASVSGLLFGGVSGHYYFGLDEAVSGGQLLRDDSSSELQNLQRLHRGRIDFTIISRSTYDYFLGHLSNGEAFFISSRPHDVFARRFLVTPAARDVHPLLQQLVHGLAADPEWQAMLEKYR